MSTCWSKTGGPVHSCRLLLEEKADLVLGVFPSLPDRLRSEELYRDQLVCIADVANPRLKNGKLTLQAFLKCPHVTVAPSSDSGIQLDDIPARDGHDAAHRGERAALPRDPSLDLRHRSRRAFAPQADRRVPVGQRTRRHARAGAVPGAELVFMQVWHARAEFDEAQVWLRDIVRRALAQGAGSARRSRQRR